MSYGVWKRRAKNWSAIEIDGCGRDADYQWPRLERDNPIQYKILHSWIRKGEVSCIPTWDGDADLNLVKWAYAQNKKRRYITEVNTNSDHSLFVAHDDAAGLQAAMAAYNINPAIAQD